MPLHKDLQTKSAQQPEQLHQAPGKTFPSQESDAEKLIFFQLPAVLPLAKANEDMADAAAPVDTSTEKSGLSATFADLGSESRSCHTLSIRAERAIHDDIFDAPLPCAWHSQFVSQMGSSASSGSGPVAVWSSSAGIMSWR